MERAIATSQRPVQPRYVNVVQPGDLPRRGAGGVTTTGAGAGEVQMRRDSVLGASSGLVTLLMPPVPQVHLTSPGAGPPNQCFSHSSLLY